MPAGAEVIVGMTQNGWCKVVYNNTVGYASADYLKTVSKVSGNFGTGTVSGSDVRMRSGAGTNSSVITTLDKGTKMSVIGASGNWYEVSYSKIRARTHSQADAVTGNAAAFCGAVALRRGYAHILRGHVAGLAVVGYLVPILDRAERREAHSVGVVAESVAIGVRLASEP